MAYRKMKEEVRLDSRVKKIDELLSISGPVSVENLAQILGVSEATVLRDLEFMSDFLYFDIAYDRKKKGYYIEASSLEAF